MKDIDYWGKDKLYHIGVCFLATIIHPLFAMGLALGKEYSDMRSSDNHFCIWDIIADSIGIAVGMILWFCIWK